MTGTWLSSLLDHEARVRLCLFLFIFAGMAIWELVLPRRPQRLGRWRRWPHNFLISILDAVVVRVVAPAGAVGFAYYASAHHLGVLPRLQLPLWCAIPVAVLLLDLVIYFQHRLFHAVPILWRLHRMHHSDVELDVSSGARFHPLEILLSLAIKCIAIALLGASPIAVLLFEILLNATAMFNHSNVRIAGGLEPWLRCILVTPDLHRVHHSVIPAETDSNFGFNLPWWDRLMGTYRDQPAQGHCGMTLGLDIFRESAEARVDKLLTQPFRDPKPSQQ